MEPFLIKQAEAFRADIFIAGDIGAIRAACRRFVREGLCVTVTETDYIFAGGSERGAVVGLINYARFPSTPEVIEEKAVRLAKALLAETAQRSCSVLTPAKSIFIEDTSFAAR